MFTLPVSGVWFAAADLLRAEEAKSSIKFWWQLNSTSCSEVEPVEAQPTNFANTNLTQRHISQVYVCPMTDVRPGPAQILLDKVNSPIQISEWASQDC